MNKKDTERQEVVSAFEEFTKNGGIVNKLPDSVANKLIGDERETAHSTVKQGKLHYLNLASGIEHLVDLGSFFHHRL